MILPSHCAQVLQAKIVSADHMIAVTPVYDAAGNVIETHEHAGER